MKSQLLAGAFFLLSTMGLIAQAETHTYTFDNGVEMDIQYLFEGPDFQPRFNVALFASFGSYPFANSSFIPLGLRTDFRINEKQKIIAQYETSDLPVVEELGEGGRFTRGQILFQQVFSNSLKKVKRKEAVHTQSAGPNTTEKYFVQLPRRIRTKFAVEGGFSYASSENDLQIGDYAFTDPRSAVVGDVTSVNLDLGLSWVRNKAINFKVEGKSASYNPFEFRAYLLGSLGLSGTNQPYLSDLNGRRPIDPSQFPAIEEPVYNRLGWRLGAEFLTPTGSSFLGAFYRAEVGRLPGYTAEGIDNGVTDNRDTFGVYFSVTAGFNFYPPKPASYSIPK